LLARGALLPDEPPEAVRAERRPLAPPVLPAEDATKSPPAENPELLAPLPEAAPDVLASEVPAEAIDEVLVRDVLLEEDEEEPPLLFPPPVLCTGLPPDMPRPPG